MAGGYLGGPHPSSEKVNAGQKVWFWTAVLMGLALSVSGLVLDFPNFGQGRELMQGAHLLHTVASVVVLAFFTVHLYLATVGVEGAFETMITGRADARWVQQHHDLWYAELESRGVAPSLPPHHAPHA
jgi:formate dehydrogenase subunit gamma